MSFLKSSMGPRETLESHKQASHVIAVSSIMINNLQIYRGHSLLCSSTNPTYCILSVSISKGIQAYLLLEQIIIPLSGRFVLIFCPLEMIYRKIHFDLLALQQLQSHLIFLFSSLVCVLLTYSTSGFSSLLF